MEKLYGTDLLKTLSEAFGPSGCEDEVLDIIKRQVGDCADGEEEVFPGNYIVRINGTSDKRLMLCAHTDEVGFMISYISDEGMLYFQCLGGIDCRVLSARRVVISGREKKIKGVIDSKAVHQQSAGERAHAISADKMYINIGASCREEAAAVVSIGDFAVFDSDLVRFGDGLIKGKALDDRCGCAVMCDVIRYIKENGTAPYYNLYFAFTVREELGRSGALTAAYAVRPDAALVLEATAVCDIADTPAHKRVCSLGGGGALSLMDNGTIYPRRAVDFALRTAEKNNIRCQLKKYVAGSTDSSHIHKAVGGVSCINLSCPARYIHSASCVISESDFEHVGRLARAIALSDELI